MSVLLDLYIIVIGLILGSFFNVVAIRLLKGESIVFPPSYCPHCQHRLSVFDLVPVFSYLFLRGTCRYCQERISLLYPLGEVLTTFSFYLTYKVLGFTWELIPALLLVTLLVLAVLTDIREQLILDKLTLPAAALLFIVRLFIGSEPFWFYLLGGVVGFLILLLIALVSKGGMGGGDIKLYISIGLVLGPWLTLLSLGLASFFGSVIGLVLILLRKLNRKDALPFAPYIFAGTLVAYLYGQVLWEWYVHHFFN